MSSPENLYDQPEEGGENHREKAREYHGLLRFNLKQRATLAGLLGILGVVGGALTKRPPKSVGERVSNAWRTTEKLAVWCDEGHFGDVTRSYQELITKEPDVRKRKLLQDEFDSIANARKMALEQEKKEQETLKSLGEVLKELF